MSRADLLTAAGQVGDVIDVAGRVVADPDNANVSRVEIAALALATEAFWAVCLEAEILVRTMALPITGDAHHDAVTDHAIRAQAERVRQLMAALRPEEPKEQNDGSCHA